MDTLTTLGTVRRRDGAWELHFERHLAHPRENVWRAITESEQLELHRPIRFDDTVFADVLGLGQRFCMKW